MNQKQEKLLLSKAKIIYSRLNLDKTSSILTIIAILQLLIALYKIFKDCNNSEEQTMEILRKPNFFQRTVMKRVIERSFPENPLNKQLQKEILEVNKKVKKSEIKLLLENGE